jgi:hypothetical protein
MMIAMYKSMPDLHITIEDMIAEGDKVVCRNIWRWTDNLSGKEMQFHGFVVWRFEGDKIAERWATVTSPAEGTTWTAGAAKGARGFKRTARDTRREQLPIEDSSSKGWAGSRIAGSILVSVAKASRARNSPV